jgi:hypothetical protein
MLIHNHVAPTVIPDNPADAVPLSKWNEEHRLNGGNHGALFVRDTASTFGGNWLASVAAGVLAAQGVGVMPAFTQSPVLLGIQFPLTTPASPPDGFMWIEASGTSPSRVINLQLRDQGVTRTLLSVTV